MNIPLCTHCATEVKPENDSLECLLCVNKTHTACTNSIANEQLPIKLITATPHFFFVCSGCIILVSSKRKRKIFRKHVGLALQKPADTMLPIKRNDGAATDNHSDQRHTSSQMPKMDKNHANTTQPVSHGNTDVSTNQLADIHLAIHRIATEQQRIAFDIENSTNRTSSNYSSAKFEQNQRGDSSSSEVFESAISFVPIINDTPTRLTKPEQILDLPTINASTLHTYNISDEHLPGDIDEPIRDQSDFHNYTASLKIIGVPTNNPQQFGHLLVSRNRWLGIKYLHIDRIYKTETSYRNSHNFIITMDNEAHKQCLDFGALHFGKGQCKIFDHEENTHCTVYTMPII